MRRSLQPSVGDTFGARDHRSSIIGRPRPAGTHQPRLSRSPFYILCIGMSANEAHRQRRGSHPLIPSASADEVQICGDPTARDSLYEASPLLRMTPNDAATVRRHATQSAAPQPARRESEPSLKQFERTYPPDAIGSELAESARVWKVYRAQAREYDHAMLGDLDKTLDILLIFAGLFSAVVTTFLVDSYKSLEPDFTEYMAGALYAISRHNCSECPRFFGGASSLSAPSQFTPSASARCLNGMWFTSLLLSLTSAFLSILAKQWIEDYRRRTSASAQSPRDWARRRTLHFTAFGRWYIPDLVTALPLFLHISMFLFISGVVILLWDLDRSNSVWLLTLTLLVVLFYSASTIFPIISPDIPLATPLTYAIRRSGSSTFCIIAKVSKPLLARCRVIAGGVARLPFVTIYRRITRRRPSAETLDLETQHHNRRRRPSTVLPFARAWISRIRVLAATRDTFVQHGSPHRRTDTQLAPLALYQQRQESLDASALRWILSANISVESVTTATQAIAAFPPWSPALEILRTNDCSALVIRALRARYDAFRSIDRNWDVPRYQVSQEDVGRDLRSALCLYGTRGISVLLADCAPALLRSVQKSAYYDIPFIIDAAYSRNDQAAATRLSTAIDGKTFHASTVLLVLQFPIALCHRLKLVDYLIERKSSDEILLHATQSGRHGASCRWESHHVLARCTLHCSIEFISSDIGSYDATSVTHALARSVVLDLIRRVDATHVMPLDDSKFLHLLATQAHDQWSHKELERALLFMAILVRALRAAPLRRTPLPAVWGDAIAATLNAAMLLSRDDGRDIASRVLTTVLTIFGLEAAIVPFGHNGPGFARQLLSQEFPGKRSPWEILNELLNPSVGNLFGIADNIVLSLYAEVDHSNAEALRDPDDSDSDLLSHFFSTSLEFQRRLVCAVAVENTVISGSGGRDRFLLFAQRCNEIKPSWLQDLVAAAAGADKEVVEASVLRLRGYLAQNGSGTATTERGIHAGGSCLHGLCSH